MPPCRDVIEAPVLVFDGDCGLCSSSARAVQRWVRASPEDFAVAAYQQIDLGALGLTEQECSTSVRWVAADGTVSSGEDAVAEVLRLGRGLVRLVGVAITLPGVHALAGVVYRWVSRHRHQLPGGSPACRTTG